jgi:hypothetical protein
MVWAILGVLFGLSYIFIPRELGNLFGYAEGPEHIYAYLAALGGCYIAVSVFIFIAARDPMRHINWVRFAILFCALELVTELYSVLRGYVYFSQAAMGVIIWAVFLAAFLIFYPWRAAQAGE